eukprot:g1160.t1
MRLRAFCTGRVSSLSEEARALGGMAAFTALKDATRADIELNSFLYRAATTPQKLAGRACDLLKLQQGAHTGAEVGTQVNLFEHALQTATRAHRDGADDEMVAAALLHDVGEMLSPSNHGDVGASILRPYISREAHWVLAHHEIFQGYYYFEHIGLDPERRRAYAGGADGGHMGSAPGDAYQRCMDFCERWDQSSFDPSYSSMELSEFVPMLERVFARPAFWDDALNPKSGAVTGKAALDDALKHA